VAHCKSDHCDSISAMQHSTDRKDTWCPTHRRLSGPKADHHHCIQGACHCIPCPQSCSPNSQHMLQPESIIIFQNAYLLSPTHTWVRGSLLRWADKNAMAMK
jgi:hypothetical protein